jgi:hypothetical protein
VTSNAPYEKAVSKLQEIRGINRTASVKIECRVVGRDAEKHISERKKVRTVGVAVAVQIAEETKNIGRRIRSGI